MQQKLIQHRFLVKRRILASAALASIATLNAQTLAGTTSGEVTISTSGSTALKNWFTAGTFTDVEPGTTLNFGGATYPTAADSGARAWSSGLSLYQLSPKNNTANLNGVADSNPAARLEYHESGSVEGILELANDQIAPVTYVTQNINRDPSTISNGLGGNAVWVNYTQFGAKGGVAWNPNGTSITNGSPLGNFYNQSGYTSGSPNVFALGGSAQAAFNTAGGNLYGGQNAVQMALSDAVPVQVFAADNTVTGSSTPWTATPQNTGYGQGNQKLASATLGKSSARQVYQSTANLNMPSGAINPRTNAVFGTGSWNSGELNNLSSTTIATTATLFVANPGTGLTQLNRTDAQWLETSGRLRNGAMFQMTTRDVNSGTRNVAGLETGIDPTWTSGVNDDGNGNADTGGGAQVTIGPGLRLSNKTAGGNELRPTVQAARMAIGTLSINDANGNANTTSGNPLRALAYSNSTDGSTPYVQANYFTIAGVNTSSGSYAGGTYANANPNGNQYTIFQNEQAVTLKAPDASYSTGNPNIQGDDSYGDVKALLNNTLNSVTAAYQASSGNTITASPVTGLMSNGYIPPQLMAVQKTQNGLSSVAASAISANPNYNNSNFLTGNGAAAFSGLVGKLTNSDPATVTNGNSSLYGASTLVAGGVTSTNGYGGIGFSSQIPIKSLSNSFGSTAGGNWMFGNFNQNGVRDYDAVVIEAQKAQAAMESGATPLGNSAFATAGQQANSTTLSSAGVTTGVTNLDAVSGLTKGDLIVLGDYNSDGKFDGKDLYLMATGASLTSAGTYRPTEAGSTFTSGTLNANAATFSTTVAAGVLNKNIALDYLQSNATPAQKTEAAQILTGNTNLSSGVPAGATATGSDVISGNVQFTYDPTGTNAFNKSDVNQDGVVDINDALAVDALNGKDYTNLSDTLTATIPTPVTGTTELANLVLMTQSDTNSNGSAHTTVDSTDLGAINSALTGSGTTNWYNTYVPTKTGSGTIIFNRSTASTVNLYAGATLNISSGTIQIASTMDPFTQNSNTSNPATSADTSKSLAIVVSTGGTLKYSGGINPVTTGIENQRLGSLNISGGTVTVDPATLHTNRTLLLTGSLTVSPAATLDLGNNDLAVQNGNLLVINNLVKNGFANGSWNAAGINSTSANADPTHLTALGVIQNSPTGASSGAALYSTFDGVGSTSADVLVKYTYYGDTNLDGQVDGTDYSRIDSAFSTNTGSGWFNGDFNYDGVINGSDYTLIDNAFNTQGNNLTSNAELATPTAEITGTGSTSAVPEPTTLGLFTVIAGSLLSRRRRRA